MSNLFFRPHRHLLFKKRVFLDDVAYFNDIVISVFVIIRSLTLTSPLAPPQGVLHSICLDLIRSYLNTLPQDPMCILLQLSSLLVEHTAPNIHDSNKSVQIQMCSVLALI